MVYEEFKTMDGKIYKYKVKEIETTKLTGLITKDFAHQCLAYIQDLELSLK